MSDSTSEIRDKATELAQGWQKRYDAEGIKISSGAIWAARVAVQMEDAYGEDWERGKSKHYLSLAISLLPLADEMQCMYAAIQTRDGAELDQVQRRIERAWVETHETEDAE